ncbi:hypothetical protein [Bradyrhizobium elkanii]
MRADARHLRHHDHRRTCAANMDGLAGTIEGNLAALEILERIVLGHRPVRHRRSS